jgi:DNA-binding protein HU-beta
VRVSELKFDLTKSTATLANKTLTINYPSMIAYQSARKNDRFFLRTKTTLFKPLFHILRKICNISIGSRSKVNTSRASEDTPLIKQDIVHQVIERTGLPRTKAEAAVDTVFEGLKQALAAGERIELRGFGVFSVRARKTGIGRNPRTGTEVSIAPGKAVRFKPGKELHSIDSNGASGS